MDAKVIGLIVLILLVGIAIGVSMTGLISFGGPATNGEWICTAVDYDTCTKVVSQEEWINTNCALNATGNVNCQILLESGQVGLIELSKLSIADEVWIEWQCILHMWGRLLNQTG